MNNEEKDLIEQLSEEYGLNVDLDALVENINNVTKIKISGAGLNDYYILSFYNNDTLIKSMDLYLNNNYYKIYH